MSQQNYKTSDRGIKAIKVREGEILKGYLDSKGLLTVAVGHLVKPGEPYKLHQPITQAESTRLLKLDLEEAEKAVNSIKVPMSQNQFDALVSFTINIGIRGFTKSQVAKRLKARDYDGAANAMMNWVKPVEITGRRKTEKAQFLRPDPNSAVSAGTLVDTSLVEPIPPGPTGLDSIEAPATQIQPPITSPPESLAEHPAANAKLEINGDKITAEANVPADPNVVIEKEPDLETVEPVGFFGALWKKITTALGGGLTAEIAIDKAQQAQTLGLSDTTWQTIFWVVIAGLIIWISYHFMVIKVIPWCKWLLGRWRTHTLIAANTSANGTVQVMTLDDTIIKALEKAGYQVIRRS